MAVSTALSVAAPSAGGPRIGGEAPIEVRPDGVVPLRRAGRAPYRVLLFGGGAMTGWGLLDHDRGLPGHLADRLAQRSGRGVDLDVIVEVEPTRAASLALLKGLRIARYDAVVVVLGEQAALEGAGRKAWAQEYEALALTLHSEASKAAPLFVFDSAAPMVAVSRTGFRRHKALSGAAKLAEVAREISAGGRIRFEELAAPPSVLGWGRQFATANLRDWADGMTKALLPALDAVSRIEGPDTGAAVRDREQDERYRQRAVDSMRLRADQRDGLLDGIARQAKAFYRASDAFVSIVDDERVWQRASSRSVLGELPRSLSFCDLTVRSDRVTLINDSSVDPRFGGGIPSIGGRPIGFYAAEPIHSVDGYRIGALCITDAEPRAMRPDQFADLHALAGRIEKELWASSLGGRR